MEKWYSISPADAAKIGEFEFAPGQVCIPAIGEQVDGNYLIRESLYKILKNTPEFKKVDFTSITKLRKDQLDPKVKGL